MYNFQWKMIREGVAWFGAQSANIEVAVGNVNNAQFVSQTVPGSMTAGQSYAVSITMRNNGSNSWTVGDYYLRSQNPQDNLNWGPNRVELPNAVASGESVTFNFNAMPAVNGYTNFQWRMAQGTTSFGALTTNVAVNVSGTNNAAFVSQSVPEVMVPGQVYAVSVTMQNTGTTTWSEANSYRLGSQNPTNNITWGMNRVYLSGTVAPGASATFNFNVTAPTTPGVYNFQWKMIREGVAWFGAQSANVAVGVNGTNDSQFISQTVPGIMSPAQSYPVSVTLQNTGTSMWTPGNYFLGSENPQANTTWGLDRVDLTAQVAPGANVTLSFNVTAPSTAGTYNFQWRMVQNSTRFGGFTTNVSVNVQQAQAMALYFVHADHLNTPRLVADAAGTTVWRWDQQEPFANNVPDENPSGLGAFDLPLRLPGQRYDAETGLHYNYFRDYDPSIGRYGESDPIGLHGGLNTYAYVGARPLLYSDPRGLWVPYIHKMMTEEALERANCRLEKLPVKTADVDILENSQAPFNSQWHHMSRPNEDAATAQGRYDDYLNENRASCDMGSLANVLHAVQDSASPVHKGMPVWSGNETVTQLVRHGMADAFPSWSDWGTAVGKSADEIAAFKARCPCVCK